jgi:hypothetical protein
VLDVKLVERVTRVRGSRSVKEARNPASCAIVKGEEKIDDK